MALSSHVVDKTISANNAKQQSIIKMIKQTAKKEDNCAHTEPEPLQAITN